jgi:hypothetical protein
MVNGSYRDGVAVASGLGPDAMKTGPKSLVLGESGTVLSTHDVF